MHLRFLAGLFAVGLWATAATPQPVLWQGSIDIATSRGVRGSWQQNESRYDFVDDPSIALDENGEAAVAWVDQASKDLWFQRFSPEGRPLLTSAVNVSRQPATFSWLPRVVLAPGSPQRVFVLWQEILFSGGSHGGDMLFAQSGDGGKTFAPPINLSQSMGGDGKGRVNREVWHNGSYDLVVARDGTLYAAWTEYEGPMWFSRSTDGGRSFSKPVRIAGNLALPARAPSLAAAPDGAVYLAWTVGENNSADIHLARSNDRGATFGRAQVIAASRNYSDAPKLAVDAEGVLHLAYAESDGGPFDRYEVRYARSTDKGRSFDTPRVISSPLPAGFEGAAYPSLNTGPDGKIVVLWELYAGRRSMPRGLGLTVSSDQGESFTPPTVVPGSVDAAGGFNGSSQGLLMKKLAVNAAGSVAVANSSLRQGSHSRVWIIRGVLR